MYYLCTQMIAEAPCKDFVLRLPLRDAIRRDGRVVDYSSLENCRTERYRGFESLSLRKRGCKSAGYAIYTLFYTQIMTVEEIDALRLKLQRSFQQLLDKIGPIQIGTPQQFPYGWRKAEKGRTVWRIIEEILIQNLEYAYSEFGLSIVEPSTSEVSVYDVVCQFQNSPRLYLNIKSSVEGGKKNKDDISKAQGLSEFYEEDCQRQFFIATCFIRFNSDMTISLTQVSIFPIAWIPDIYVNPSNNGNLQSSSYKDIKSARKRTNAEFIPLLRTAIQVAETKKIAKNSK